MAISLHNKNPRGVTLIELLVVVAIISVLTAVMIPRLRTINKDRNIREAARIVGSTFANASQRAIAEGTAGVIIERNANIQDQEDVIYGASTLFSMRSVPPYIGDEADSQVTKKGDFVLHLPRPLEQDISPVVLVNDYVSVNNNSLRYRILRFTDPDADPLELVLSPGVGPTGYLPSLPGEVDDAYEFVIHRQPRKMESSRVDLPAGFLIDMRYSGPLNPDPLMGAITGSPRSWFHEEINQSYGTEDGDAIGSDPWKAAQARARTTQIIFNADGGIDRIYFYNPNYNSDYHNPEIDSTLPEFVNGFIDSRILLGALNLFVAPYETEPPANYGELDSPSSLWVTINNTTGSVNVGSNVPSAGANLGERINNARSIARTGQSASQ